MPGLLGSSGGAEADDAVEVAAAEAPPFEPAAMADGLVGIGGGADLPLANAAGPEAIRRSTVGEVEIVLRKGAPAVAEVPAAVTDASVGEAGVEVARSEALSPPDFLPSDKLAICVLLVGDGDLDLCMQPPAARRRKGFETSSSSSLLSVSDSSCAGRDTDVGSCHHCC